MAYTGLNPAIAWLTQLEAGLENLTPFMQAVASHVAQVSKDSFAKQGSPGGVPWAMLSPRTVRDRAKLGYGPVPILVRRGALRDSIREVIDAGGASASIGSDLIYAGVHQRGQNQPIPVPARPYLGLVAGSQPVIWAALSKHLALE